MTLVAIPGQGFWMPTLMSLVTAVPVFGTTDAMTLDANEEEAQFFGTVTIVGGGSKTFGTSSKLGWLPGPAITFAAGATVRLGLKVASTIDTTAGGPARATLGPGAFAMYRDLVGGTDTITSTAWREDPMNAGTPVTVSDGEEIVLAWHLNVASGSHSVKLRGASAGTATASPNYPTQTLVTSGPAYTRVDTLSNIILIFDDGTLGWLEPSYSFTEADAASATIGDGNIYGNVFQVPFPCKIDALAAHVTLTSAARNWNLELYATPLGTPTLLAALDFDGNVLGLSNTNRPVIKRLPTPQTLAPATEYLVGVKQTTANSLSVHQYDVQEAAYFQPSGLDATCYAANSIGGATFVAQNSGRRRYRVWVRVSHLDDGMGNGGAGIGRRMAIGVP